MQQKNAAIVIQTASDTREFNLMEKKGEFIVYDPTLVTHMTSDFFSDHHWRAQNAITGSAQGRGTTWFFVHRERHMVLRHYYRGGMIGKLLDDQYLFTGLLNSRAYQEFKLLAQLQALNLPAPAPVAIKVQRKALVYCSNDIVSTRINNTDSLAAILRARALSAHLWQRIGTTIRRFHDHQVFHHDLNAHNILIDEAQTPWLIDFDQGEIRANNDAWKQANLARLKRSLLKEKGLNAKLCFQESDWKTLLQGYGA